MKLEDSGLMAENFHPTELRDYRNPPVVETILGVQFERLPKFSNAHLGAFWKTLDENQWPMVADAPVLPTQIEEFVDGSQWLNLIGPIQFMHELGTRIQIKNTNLDRMIQVQNGRFHYNWLGEAGGEYPRYDAVRNGFDSSLRKFVSFIDAIGAGSFSPNQWEVTYLNQIPKGTVWNTSSDWNFFRPLCSLAPLGNGLRNESFAGQWQFEIPEQRGRLHVSWQLAKKRPTDAAGDELIQLTLTARGPVSRGSDHIASTMDGLNLGRETIVTSFRELMTTKANKYWEGSGNE